MATAWASVVLSVTLLFRIGKHQIKEVDMTIRSRYLQTLRSATRKMERCRNFVASTLSRLFGEAEAIDADVTASLVTAPMA